MKKYVLAAGVLCATLVALTAKNSDPVLMKVGKKEVPLSEFMYLYNKNNTQQAQPQTIDEYVDMFVNFKLKVAAAEAAGLDTTKAFLDEYIKFRNDLAAPYLRDTVAEQAQIREAYDRMKTMVTVSHIMVPTANAALADSLLAEIKAGNITFEDAARRYSIDKPSAARGGMMGAVIAGRLPAAFENAAYATPKGQLSEVVNSGFGNHIIRVESVEPAKGSVHAAHILRTTRGMSEDAAARQKDVIDSLYRVLATDPSVDFAAMATEFSQDPGSARRGGDLGFFSSGQMVHEFDSVAFSLPDNTVSAPFKTAFGWHIIKRYEGKSIGSLEDNLEAIKGAIDRDPVRKQYAENVYIDNVISRYKGSVSEPTLAAVKAKAEAAGGNFETLLPELAASKLTIVTFDGKNYTLAQLAPSLPSVAPAGADNIEEFVRAAADNYLRTIALDRAREDLAATNTDYSNLIKEYRDGILLFDISNREVWEKATADTTGLNNYFQAHRDNYRWETPRYKAVIVFAGNDSVLQLAAKYAADSIAPSVPSAKIAEIMGKRFGREVKVERVIAARGDNAITDYLGFGAPKPEKPLSTRWPVYVAVRSKILEQPEEVADLRAAVVADYQNSLEKAWLDKLHKQIPVKINKKVLSSAR